MLSSRGATILTHSLERMEDTPLCSVRTVLRVMKRASSTSLLRTAFALTLCVPAHALGEQPGTGGVEQVAFRQPAPKIPAERVRFQRRAAQVGDRVEQEVSLQMRMTTSIRQANELAGQHRNTVTSNLRRKVTTLEVADGRTSAVTVEYQVANKGVVESDDTKPRNSQASNNTDDLQKHPVEGKTYLCRREPGQDGALLITDVN